MIFAIVFAQLWGVIQLIALASLSRTVRVRTVIAAMAAGLYAVAPVAVILQKSWIGVAASLVGKSMAEMTGIASYTVDPFIEEALKLLPLVLLMLIPAIRRQWTVTDCLLIAAAIGSGFGLAEHLYRYGSSPDAAEAVRGGWVMTFGRYTPTVPGIATTLTSWLPNGVWFPEDPTRVNWHLAWSALGGLGLGLAVRNPKRAARLTAVGLFLLIGLDHAAGNTHDIGSTWLAFLAAPLDLVTSHLGFLVLVAVVAAWWLDRAAQPGDEALEPLLAAEQSASPRLVGTFTAAFKRLPWSIPWVFGFDRARRAYHVAHATAPESVSGMLAALVAERDSVDRKLTQAEAPPLIPPSWNPAAMRATLRKRPVIISLVLLAPSIFYLIIGGFPQTAWVQAVVTSGLVWPLVILITVAAQAKLVWRVASSTRDLAKTSRLPIGDDAAILGLQLACGIGSVALGGFTLMRVFSGVSVGSTLLSHAHASDAANRITPGSGVSVSNSGGGFGPSSSGPGSSNSSQGSNSSSNSSDSNSGSNSQPPAQGQSPPAPNGGSPSDYSPLPPPATTSRGEPSDYSPLPDPVIPVKDLPDAPSDPYEYSPLPDPVIPVKDLPDAPYDPNEYSPLPDPVIPVKDLPDAPSDPSEYSPLPDPVIPVKDLPDAPVTSPSNEDGVGTRYPDDMPGNDDGVGTRVPDNEDGVGTRVPDSGADGPTIEPVKPMADPNASSNGTPDNEDGVGTRVPDDEDGYGTRHPDSNPAPSRPQPTAQEQADRAADDAADAAAKADADAQAARQRLTDAHNAEDSNDIKRTTADPGSDPDVAAARQRTNDAQKASENADQKALDGDDPWDTSAPKKSAADQANSDAQAAKNAQDQEEYDYSQRQKAADAADQAADKAASEQAQDALNAANAKAAAAHEASAKAASAAGHAASAESAASDYAAAQAKADAAWYGKDRQAFIDAQNAANAAKERLDAAQAAADAARDKPDSVAGWPHHKP